ncbi:prepilin peptidase-dependent protein [Zophobihabitans entericus]|uniref:Prepilin peptidase-dependent protein n=1 Tax=Zophobihabitans entericus TaxID=1635327 RepID=A0A6G9IDD3_9GAMM|nr:prepilin peptidase-dependent protein [Zophobihabitans entericus]QIQ21714.1 prepilin peptidase-dependent protein [Zophobihabitans entericus]
MLERGFSLFEMLIVLSLSSLMMMAAMVFYPQLQLQIVKAYQVYRLDQSLRGALAGLGKDLRRAGFIAGDTGNAVGEPIEISSAKDCVIIRYDLDRTGKWEYHIGDAKTSDIFVYRLNKNNLEYRTGVPNCTGTGWEKILDEKEIKIVAFKLQEQHGYIQIILTGLLKNQISIEQTLTQIIKYENRLLS